MKYFKHKTNDSFFSIPNSLNCYWAGFLAADGCIRDFTHRNGKRVRIYGINISLSNKDINHLYSFKKDIETENPIHEYKQSKYEKCTLHISSEKIQSDLLDNFSIGPRKSLTYTYPNLENKQLIDSFIIGYIDGDGCIQIVKNKKNKISLSICGTEVCLQWMRKRFCEILDKKETWGNICKTKNIYTFASCGEDVLNLLKYYDQFELPKLRRKWDKIEAARQIYSQYKLWTKEEEEALINLHPTQTCRQIWENYFRDRPYTAVEKKIHYLGLKKHYEREWDIWEEKIIKDNFNIKRSRDIWEEYFQNYRSLASLKGKIQTMKRKNEL